VLRYRDRESKLVVVLIRVMFEKNKIKVPSNLYRGFVIQKGLATQLIVNLSSILNK